MSYQSLPSSLRSSILSARRVAKRAELVGAMHRALTIAVETPRTHGPEFDTVVDLIRERDAITLDDSDLTPECIGQLMGGN